MARYGPLYIKKTELNTHIIYPAVFNNHNKTIGNLRPILNLTLVYFVTGNLKINCKIG